MTKKELNILDDVKDYDRKVRTKIVYKKLDTLKEWAKTIVELKEKTEMMLQELKVEDADIKRLIDYVNSQVELTLEDKEKLRKEVKSSIESAKKEKDVTNVQPSSYTTMDYFPVNGTSNYTLTTTAGSVNTTSTNMGYNVSDTVPTVTFSVK